MQKYLTNTFVERLRQRAQASTSLPPPRGVDCQGRGCQRLGGERGLGKLQQLAIEQYNSFGPRSLPLDAQISRSPTALDNYIPYPIHIGGKSPPPRRLWWTCFDQSVNGVAICLTSTAKNLNHRWPHINYWQQDPRDPLFPLRPCDSRSDSDLSILVAFTCRPT